ncbi:MAG TPA: hydrogenase maturation nickel metallochaperone HypA [Conexibacter sp.]|jgi:hydrogenase nickel incorporation protein HypA/HybF|nr:hydrogenase maturation nickel metallochaperone HypA [Conexibacter sp.]
MHELAIADSIVRIASERAGPRRVRTVRVAAGYLRQVVPDALAFAFELVALGTPVEGAELELRAVLAEARCRTCGARTEQDAFPLCCGTCGALDVEVVAGEELMVEELELEEEAEVAHGR